MTVDPTNGQVSNAKSFDTYTTSNALETFIENSIPNGHIIALACQDDCITNLSDKVRAWLASIGSKQI